MRSFPRLGALAAATFLAGVLAAPTLAEPTPDATIHFKGGSVAFIVGGSWGSGELKFHGRTYKLKVKGLSVGAIGASSFEADGEVYGLTKVSDIEGTYGAADVSATAGAGAGILDLKNTATGVEIHAHATSSGLKLSLAPSGMQIELK